MILALSFSAFALFPIIFRDNFGLSNSLIRRSSMISGFPSCGHMERHLANFIPYVNIGSKAIQQPSYNFNFLAFI
jgi:hypothetical protein